MESMRKTKMTKDKIYVMLLETQLHNTVLAFLG